jgi:DNA segregation ATPase FtsK/SpoIIIE, S-DNA-T family
MERRTMTRLVKRRRTAQTPAARTRRGLPGAGDLGRLPVAELRVLGGPGAGRRVPLEPGEHRLGSHRYSRIIIDDDALMRVHLLIRVDAAGETWVTPASPDAGCRLDGEPVTRPTRTRPGQLLAAGRSLLALGLPGETAPRPPALEVPRTRLARTGPPRIEAPTLALARSAALALGGTVVGTAVAAGLAGALWGPAAALVPVGLAPGAGLGALVLSQQGALEASARFRRALAELDRELAGARSARQARAGASAPDAADLLARLERGETPRRLREDPDWLRLRLGWADQPSGLGAIVTQRGALGLRMEALRVAARHATLPGSPVSVSLPQAGPLGITGDPAAGMALARWLAIQVAALHDPEDAMVVAALPAAMRRGFGWLPALALGPDEGARLVDRLAGLVARRSAAGEGGPAIVAILHCAVVDRVARALVAGRRVGVHVVWLAADEERRRSCGAVLHLPADTGSPALTVGDAEPRTLGGADGLTAELAGRIAPSLRMPTAAAPARPALADVLAAAGEPEHEVLASWIRDRADQAPRRLRAALGVDPAGRPVELDLRRAGPHVLVTGGPGTGKSALLRCVVASLAVRHAPRSLNLLLLGAGADAFAGLGDLPHTLDLLAGPGERDLRRALDRLADELRWRLTSDRSPAAPSLVVAVDELPEPPLAERLLEALAPAARRGPDLGIHLLVATRDPGAVTASLGPRRRLRVAMGEPGRPALVRDGGRTREVRPAATDGLEALARAAAAVGRMLGEPARASWPSGGTLQSAG